MSQQQVTVIHGDEKITLAVTKGDSLLLSLVQAGLPVSFACTTGKCATCQLKMDLPHEGANPMSDTERYRLGEAAVREGYRLSCQVYVQGDLTVYLPE